MDGVKAELHAKESLLIAKKRTKAKDERHWNNAWKYTNRFIEKHIRKQRQKPLKFKQVPQVFTNLGEHSIASALKFDCSKDPDAKLALNELPPSQSFNQSPSESHSNFSSSYSEWKAKFCDNYLLRDEDALTPCW